MKNNAFHFAQFHFLLENYLMENTPISIHIDPPLIPPSVDSETKN